MYVNVMSVAVLKILINIFRREFILFYEIEILGLGVLAKFCHRIGVSYSVPC